MGRGLSMAEAVVSIAIVGTMMVAAMSAVGAAVRTRYASLWRVQGQQLARALMAEILPAPYRDPDEDPNTPAMPLGCEPGESATDRSTFDDVDDFNGYQQSPPRAPDGSALTTEPNWSWRATVEWVNPSSPGGAASLTATSAKRITVTVLRNGAPVAALVSLRANVDTQ